MLTLKLLKHGYLNIRGHKPDRAWMFYGLIGSITVLLMILLVLCYWVIQYISTPLEPLKKAVQRLAYDIKAPMIEETCSDEMCAVIHAFNDMQQNIRRLLDNRTHMLAAISHDLRTPITRLKLRAENIGDEKLQAKVIADLNDMEQMISSILAFAREQNADELMRNFDLVALIESICNDMVDGGKAVTFQNEIKKLTYYSRMLSLKRAVTNVIENAIKYGNSCAVSVSQTKDHVRLSFVDNGPGIPHDKLEKVFAPFYRVDSARSPTTPGAGLGLSVVKEIIGAHGGDVKLTNLPEGLSMCITLATVNQT
jgi:signal transduction histidine kinase